MGHIVRIRRAHQGEVARATNAAPSHRGWDWIMRSQIHYDEPDSLV
jgi:hypothetical protein